MDIYNTTTGLTFDMRELAREELELEELELEELEESTLDFGGVLMSTNLLLRREEELDDLDDLDDLDEAEEEEEEEEEERRLELLLEWDLRERELLEEEEDLVPFFRPGTRMFRSFSKTFFSTVSSSWLMVITLMIFSAAFSPIWISISIFSITGPLAASKWY